jgi:hypothetical protein
MLIRPSRFSPLRIRVRPRHSAVGSVASTNSYGRTFGSSPHDRIWGIDLSTDDERATHPDQWRGLNLLGFALMSARSRLCEQ